MIFKSSHSIMICSIMMIVGTFAMLSPKMKDLYVDICGEQHLCPYQLWGAGKQGDVSLKECPKCNCYSSRSHLPLCPDIVSHSRCYNASILSASSKKTHYHLRMIDSCYEDTNNTLQDLCSKEEPDLLNLYSYPVKDHNNYYRNEYCAICNNAADTERLRLAVTDCDLNKFDMNIYESVEELRCNVKKSKCNFVYNPISIPLFDSYSACSTPSSISHCNVTGLWDTWDTEISDACMKYDSPIFLFKNVFCYACNTGSSDMSSSIRTCTNHDNSSLEKECLNGPADPRTFPYWNKHCRHCNIISGISHSLVHGYNKSAIWPYETSIHVLTDVCLLRYSNEYKFLLLSTTVKTYCKINAGSPSDMGEFPDKELEASFELQYSRLVEKRGDNEPGLNFQDLYTKYVNYSGRGTWCGSPDGADCSCDLSCFVFQNCCPDMWQNDRVECRKMDDRHTVVIKKCPDGFADKALQYYCERNESDLMTVLDFTPSVDYDIMNPEFKNIFCLICNIPSQIKGINFQFFATTHPYEV